MKTKITFLNTACRAIVVAAVFLFIVLPFAMTQPADVTWILSFSGTLAEHEGMVGWNADGSGPEPYGIGHLVPLPGWDNMPYYGASRDYDDIDPDPMAAAAHLTGFIQGFPLFVQALAENGFTPEQVQIKSGLSDLGEDMEGIDWFVINGSVPHSFYYGQTFNLLVDGEKIIEGHPTFNDVFCTLTWRNETSYFTPDSAWADDTDPVIKAVGMAFLEDIGDEEIRLFTNMEFMEDWVDEYGRTGMSYDITGHIEKGLPGLPYRGYASDHQGMAGWNADGTGPEEFGDGHGAQRYYIASRDYGDIDPDTNAAFGHFLQNMQGFLNFNLQMQYRNIEPDRLLIKQGLASLGNDVMGLDWGFENGTDYWCNYYDNDYLLELDGEVIIRGLIDTSNSWMNADPVYWYCEATLDRPRDGSALSSPDAQIIAAAFMKDIECRKMINDVQKMTYDTASFSGNGRYDGGYFNVETACLVFKNSQNCCFVQCDTLGGGMSNHTDWTLAHSPYLIDNDLVIAEGQTLNIEPGVKVAIRGPYSIDLLGSIQATGEEGDTIMFTQSNPLVNWNSIRIPGADPEADSSLFSYCVFEHGYASSEVPIGYNSGGAFKIRDFDKIRFSHCIFRDNLVDMTGILPPSGGAIALWTASPLIEYCSFYGNIAGYGGAMICYTEANPIIKYSLFHGNRALVDGGAIIVYDDSAPILLNNTITENMAFDNGGGVDLYTCTGDSVVFINNIIWHNTSVNAGHQISLTSPDNIATFKYNDIEGGLAGLGPEGSDHLYYAENNIDEDSMFCIYDVENPYAIYDCSLCADHGMGGTYIGAFDWACICTDLAEKIILKDGLTFYPNPAPSGSLSVSFFIENPGQERIEIYNLTGEKVAEPVNGYYTAGEHQVTFSIEALPAGIYIGRLTAGNQARTCKFAKMR